MDVYWDIVFAYVADGSLWENSAFVDADRRSCLGPGRPTSVWRLSVNAFFADLDVSGRDRRSSSSSSRRRSRNKYYLGGIIVLLLQDHRVPGWLEFAGLENDKPSKTGGEICRTGKWRDKVAGVEFAGLENDGLENDGLENDGLENAGLEQEQTYVLHTLKTFNVYDMFEAQI